jgi:hypothetical protein
MNVDEAVAMVRRRLSWPRHRKPLLSGKGATGVPLAIEIRLLSVRRCV